MTFSIASQRCFNHAQREAVARCPECGRCFCRECISEHQDRMLCADCLRKLASLPTPKRRGLAGLLRLGQCALGMLLVWFFFYLLGEGLLRLPTSFHEGTLWRASWLEVNE
jgi:hypothetical protein